MQRSLDEEVEHYVRTGEHDDHLFVGWPGNNLVAWVERGRNALAERARCGGPQADPRRSSDVFWAVGRPVGTGMEFYRNIKIPDEVIEGLGETGMEGEYSPEHLVTAESSVDTSKPRALP